MFTVQLDDKLYSRLAFCAKDAGTTVENLIASVLKEHADREDVVNRAVDKWRRAAYFN